jgi:hypothetical protein
MPTATTITIHAMKKHDAASERNASLDICTTLAGARAATRNSGVGIVNSQVEGCG